MPSLYLVNLMNTKDNCHIQQNNFHGATVGGNITVTNAHSGENICGDAGTTSGGSTFVNKTSSSADSSASASSSAGNTAQ